VTAAYIDALIAAATPTNLDEPESMCPLEEDFERNWPDEREYLPPPGREPGPREGSWYVPDATGERREIFKGFEFVFFDSRQFETLMGPITDGAGKALLYEVEVDGTSVGDVLGWARKTLGDVATADLGDEEEPGAGGSVGTDPGVDVGVVERDEGGKRMGPGLVFVKFQGGAEWEAWAANLQRDLALACNMRLIEQNEFLDVILRRDPGLLRRRLPVEYVQDSMVARTQVEFGRCGIAIGLHAYCWFLTGFSRQAPSHSIPKVTLSALSSLRPGLNIHQTVPTFPALRRLRSTNPSPWQDCQHVQGL